MPGVLSSSLMQLSDRRTPREITHNLVEALMRKARAEKRSSKRKQISEAIRQRKNNPRFCETCGTDKGDKEYPCPNCEN